MNENINKHERFIELKIVKYIIYCKNQKHNTSTFISNIYNLYAYWIHYITYFYKLLPKIIYLYNYYILIN